MTNPVISSIRRSLGRTEASVQGPRPAIHPARQAESIEQEICLFLQEIEALEGSGQRLRAASLAGSLQALVAEQNVRKATLWDTPFLRQLSVAAKLQAAGVELTSPTADKHALAQCDLGITEADFLLAETGTVVLRCSKEKPRAVSLLPPAHLVIASPEAFRPDLHPVFAEVKNDPYVVFVSGASRTGDIEMVGTLGVHGPRNLLVWLVQP